MFDLEKHTIFATLHGSRAYGTNIASSDSDFKGVAIPPKEYFLGYFSRFEQAEQLVSKGHPHDKTIYDIRKFLNLAANTNPNIIEVLFTDPSDHTVTTKWSDRLLAHRDLFISKKARFTFSGYAYGQLKRIKSHRAWLLNPPTHQPLRTEFGLPSDTSKAVDVSTMNAVDSLSSEGHTFSEEVMATIQKEKKYSAALQYWKQYQEWKATRNADRAELEAKHGFDCYSDDTEFLTHAGWKKFDDVTASDTLATVFIRRGIPTSYSMSHRTFLGVEYESFTDKFEGNYSGPMYHLTGHHTDTLVTPNHRLLFCEVERKTNKSSEWVLEEASFLPDTFDTLIAPTPRSKNYSNGTIFDGLPIPSQPYLVLMGWYLSDGSAHYTKDGKPKSIRISQKLGGKLSWSMARWQGDHGSKTNSSLHQYERKPNSYNSETIQERILDVRDTSISSRIIAECGDTNNKRIPRWVFCLSRSLMEKLLFALLGGDGTVREHKTKASSYTYYSKFKPLADDVQELALLCGWETALWGPYESTDVDGRSILMYQVHLRKVQSRLKRFIRSANVSKIEVCNRRIVCFTVPNGTLITRRNGKVGIHGNSKHGMHLIRLQRMCAEILEGKGVLVKRPDFEELLAIRHGGWTYDQVVEESDRLETKVVSLYETSTLPATADGPKIDALCISLVEDFLSSL